MTQGPTITVRYTSDTRDRAFKGDRDSLIQWVSFYVWLEYRGTGYELEFIEVEDGSLPADMRVTSTGLDNNDIFDKVLNHRLDLRMEN